VNPSPRLVLDGPDAVIKAKARQSKKDDVESEDSFSDNFEVQEIPSVPVKIKQEPPASSGGKSDILSVFSGV